MFGEGYKPVKPKKHYDIYFRKKIIEGDCGDNIYISTPSGKGWSAQDCFNKLPDVPDIWEYLDETYAVSHAQAISFVKRRYELSSTPHDEGSRLTWSFEFKSICEDGSKEESSYWG